MTKAPWRGCTGAPVVTSTEAVAPAVQLQEIAQAGGKHGLVDRALSWDLGDLGLNPSSATDCLWVCLAQP